MEFADMLMPGKYKHSDRGETMELFNQENVMFDEQLSNTQADDNTKSTDKVAAKFKFRCMTPLEWDEKIVDLFQKHGRNPNFANQYGVPLLFHAINFGTTQSMRMLLEAGADVNFVSWQGYSPWFLAVDSREMAKIHLLEEFHADQTVQNHLGHNALHLIAMRGDVRLFHYLIHHMPESASLAVNRWGDTLLHLTASSRHPLQTRICLTHTAIPIDARNQKGETAFLRSLKDGDLSSAHLIMNAGSDIHIPDHNGLFPLNAAFRFQDTIKENLNLIQNMLSAGAAPDTCDPWGETPLFLAVKRHWDDALQLILSYPVDVHHAADPESHNRKNSQITPIMLAVRDGQTKIAERLLHAHADPNSTLNGKTLLYHAVKQRCSDMVELLIASGAKVEAISVENPEDITPVQLAIKNEDIPVVRGILNQVQLSLSGDKIREMIDHISNTELRDLINGIAVWKA